MKSFGAFEAKNTLGALLDLVESGEEVGITRHGKLVAELVPPRKAFDRKRALEAAERIVARGREAGGAAFDWEEWKAFRDEGRR